jgi:hypothetical protein
MTAGWRACGNVPWHCPEHVGTPRGIDPSLRRVTQLPVTELWDASGVRSGRVVREDLSEDDIRQLLRRGPVQFVELRMSERPNWVPPDAAFAFWKERLQPRLTQWAPDGRIYTDEFPVYAASEWEIDDATTPVVAATLLD